MPLSRAEAGGPTLTGLLSSGSSVAAKDEAAPGTGVAGAVALAAAAEAVALAATAGAVAAAAAAEAVALFAAAGAVVLAGTCAWLESP